MLKLFSRYWLKFAVFALAAEVTLLTIAAVLAIHIRLNRASPAIFGEPITWLRIATFVATICLATYLDDLFDFRIHYSARQLGLRLIRSLSFAVLGLWCIYYVIPSLSLGRGVLAIAFILAVPPLLLWRIALHSTLASRMFPERILIVGSGASATEIAREVIDRSHLGYHVLGFLDDDPSLQDEKLVNPGVLGVTSDACTIALARDATKVVVAQRDSRGKLDVDALLDCKTQGVPVERGVDFLEKLTGQVTLEGPRVRSWLLFSEGFVVSRSQLLWKRILDLAVATVQLLATVPLMLLVAIAIRLESPGPVLFKQARVGRGGEVFTLWKFRSMREESEAERTPRWADENDPRITRVGKILRKWRIDELPQLWNVFRGDMSLVGPRPEQPEFVSQLSEHNPLFELRHAVRPGLTGWAQIKSSYAASVSESIEKLKYDLYYVKNLSIFLDISILASTIRIVLLGRGSQ